MNKSLFLTISLIVILVAFIPCVDAEESDEGDTETSGESTEESKGFFGKIIDAIKGIFSKIADFFRNIISSITGFFSGLFSGPKVEYTEIHSIDDLADFKTDGNYILMADLDMLDYDWPPMNFSGDFNGNGFTISNMGSPLFINSTGKVHDLMVTGGFNVTGTDYTGSIIEVNKGTVSNVKSSVVIRGDSPTGGIVGYNEGTISDCTYTGKIESSSNYVGGIVSVQKNGTITRCTNTADIKGQEYVGGIAGSLKCALNGEKLLTSNCTIEGRTHVAGLFGDILAGIDVVCQGDKVENVTIRGGHYLGSLTGSTSGNITGYKNMSGKIECTLYYEGAHIGGIVGGIDGDIKDCISNVDINCSKSGQNVGGIAGFIIVHGGTVNLTNNGNITGGDINVGGIFGFLRSAAYGSSVVKVYNLSQLTNNGNVKSDSDYVGGIVGHSIYTQNWSAKSYSNYSNCSSTGDVTGRNFVGGIIGDGHADIANTTSEGTISGKSYVGGISGGSHVLKNCSNSATVKGNGYNIGGLAGRCTAIIDCENSGTVSTSGKDKDGRIIMGGLAGECTSVNYSINNGKIEPKVSGSYVGGIAGIANLNQDCSEVKNTINIKIDGDYIGGLFGKCSGGVSVMNSSNSGIITGKDHVGGIAGYNDGVSIREIENTTEVRGQSNVGGIVGGSSNSGKMINCTNNGTITATVKNLGGIAGYGRCTGCINNGTVVMSGDGSSSYVGGIAGQSTGSSDCTNNGKLRILGECDKVGGVIGSSLVQMDYGGLVNNAEINVSGNCIGGIIGYCVSSNEWNTYTISGCKNYGDVNAIGNDVGGIIGHIHTAQSGFKISYINLVNSECKADVSGRYFVGGAVGENFVVSGTCGNLKNLTHVGQVAGTNTVNKIGPAGVIDCNTSKSIIGAIPCLLVYIPVNEVPIKIVITDNKGSITYPDVSEGGLFSIKVGDCLKFTGSGSTLSTSENKIILKSGSKTYEIEILLKGFTTSEATSSNNTITCSISNISNLSTGITINMKQIQQA